MTTLFIILFALLVYLSLYLAYKAGKKAEYFSLQRKAQKALDLTFVGVKTKEDMDKALDKAGVIASHLKQIGLLCFHCSTDIVIKNIVKFETKQMLEAIKQDIDGANKVAEKKCALDKAIADHKSKVTPDIIHTKKKGKTQKVLRGKGGKFVSKSQKRRLSISKKGK